MPKPLASQTTWNGFESPGSIKIGAEDRLSFAESNAARFSGFHSHVTSFFSSDDNGWINPA
ncbi:hypothetical protein PC129_g15071 [Phytophthora cactorum]|uniref:Uncharacterized protein n=1 Tax=Phytophthora cactorum TaxID=29920 RepID=A0A329SHN9_9STRA|nr:hypothetical protein Pcac1_g15334 [Phytophthora cactorum]KAG2806514.1 hypothetical protein PC112_g17815 [Phytophthora cactorum]KAG2810821.1 hypothetical protein PC111_g15490 [Phytophthora cactorum]KAG2850601.1 hypothetical protein PC113_g16648 [Phytophthora cactorum]KAG2894582.1 hypothetical protein PC117_g23448 [Phytophthora cactorum]